MNVTELARRLRVSPKELIDLLPQFGFDIGGRAIKVDPRVAQRILREWPKFYKEHQARIAAERKQREREERAKIMQDRGPISLPAMMTVRELSEIIDVPVTKVIAELMNNGILATMNERIDFATAAIIAEDLGLQVEQSAAVGAAAEESSDARLKELLAADVTAHAASRPPVVVVMGHVDHGKTKLLDAIRNTNVVAGEHGGITQHIGAYQAEYQGRKITFIDTPGHEAFAAMRSRGAKVADIAILLVAADDSIKPQTVEAIQIIQAIKLPFVVAINKIDKPEANVEKVKQDLAARNLLPEDWGGKVVCVPISAKDGKNIGQLLETILLVADLEKEKIVADPDRLAVGTVIEAHKDPGEGAVATVLVQSGTLHTNDTLGVAGVLYGRVRAMRDWNGAEVTAALPGMPVKVLGWKQEPKVGDALEVAADPKTLSVKKVRPTGDRPAVVTATSGDDNADATVKTLNIILKSDVLGSAEAISESLEKLQLPDGIDYRIIARGLGNVTEGDVQRAEGDNAVVLGFNVQVSPTAMELAEDKGVEVKTYKIIYELLDLVKEKLNAMLEAKVNEIDLGVLEVLALFRKDKKGQVVGGRVKSGVVALGAKARLIRDGLDMDRLTIAALQSGKQDVKEVDTGFECGLQLTGKLDVAVGDTLQVYREERIEQKVK